MLKHNNIKQTVIYIQTCPRCFVKGCSGVHSQQRIYRMISKKNGTVKTNYLKRGFVRTVEPEEGRDI